MMIVFRGLSVSDVVLRARVAITVHVHPDDSTNPANRSATYDLAEPVYDLHVTTKTHNVGELRQRGVRRVLYLPCAYDRDWHRPAVGVHRNAYQVGFIGTRRPDRRTAIRDIAALWGKQFLICGSHWNRELRLRRMATVKGPQYGFDFAMAVACAPVQLGLLNSENRDRHTCRSFEVPASGGVLVAERTAEHLSMLEEKKEALFFSFAEELQEHLLRLASEPGTVHRMGRAAAARILGGRNTYDDRWASILSDLGVDG
jgi:spore maturation protein CgeB